MLKHILTDTIRADKEYAQLLDTTRKQFQAKTPYPILINGLCEGGTDALLVSLLEDMECRCALIVCSEEKDCVRIADLLSRYGKRSAFFVGRDLTF